MQPIQYCTHTSPILAHASAHIKPAHQAGATVPTFTSVPTDRKADDSLPRLTSGSIHAERGRAFPFGGGVSVRRSEVRYSKRARDSGGGCQPCGRGGESFERRWEVLPERGGRENDGERGEGRL